MDATLNGEDITALAFLFPVPPNCFAARATSRGMTLNFHGGPAKRGGGNRISIPPLATKKNPGDDEGDCNAKNGVYGGVGLR